MTKEAYWNTFLKLYPKEDFWPLLREYDNELAKKGMYIEIEPKIYKKHTPENERPLTPKEQIKEIESFIRNDKRWLGSTRKKAKDRGIDKSLAFLHNPQCGGQFLRFDDYD